MTRAVFSSGPREQDDELHHLFLASLPADTSDFARSRFDEGNRTVALLRAHFPQLFHEARPRVLDLGSGNGGMLFPFARESHAIALDTYIDPDLRRFKARSGLQVSHLRGNAAVLPFRSGSLDIVLMAEVVEHLERPRAAAAEIMRALRIGGVCLISTPPRLKFLGQRDPHFGIRFLVALPDPLQRAIAARASRGSHCYVNHIYATTWGLHRLFPRGSCAMRVISHRQGWTRHLSWNYIAFEKTGARRAA
jgi:SAM-dependent methyltransferase